MDSASMGIWKRLEELEKWTTLPSVVAQMEKWGQTT